MNPKQKKFLAIAGIAVAVFYFFPAFFNAYQRAAYIRQMQAIQAARAQAAQKSSPLPASPPQLPADDKSGMTPATFNNLLGVWQGGGAVPNRGMCNLKLELRKAPTPGQLTGFPTLFCMPATLQAMRPGNPALMQITPAAAVLTGTAKDGAIDFQVTRVLSKGSGCEMTGFTVTPFGNDQIAAQWQEGTCPGGELQLKLVTR